MHCNAPASSGLACRCNWRPDVRLAMAATLQRFEFAPPQEGGSSASLALALLAHGLLLAALAWGVTWQHHARSISVEAELWAAVPVQAAPRAVEPPPEPTPAPPPPPTLQNDANIVLQRQKAQREAQRQAELEQARQQETERKAQAAAKLKQEQANAKALERQRQENLARLAGLAQASGTGTATGSAAKAAGPSSGYAARVTARVKPNIVFTEEVTANPAAEVEVRCAPDGTIVGRKLIKPSGIRAWDDAVLKAIDKTERLPRDADGRVYDILVISFRPRD